MDAIVTIGAGVFMFGAGSIMIAAAVMLWKDGF